MDILKKTMKTNIYFLLLQLVIKNYQQNLQNSFIETINEGKKGEYEKYFMKIKFNSADDLPLNKMLKLHKLTVILRSVF